MPLLVWLGVYFSYAEGSRLWTSMGGTSRRHWLCEIPLFVAIAWCLHFPADRRHPGALAQAALAACLPLLVAYIGYDVAAECFQHAPRVSDLGNLGLLFDVSVWWGLGAFAAPLVALMPSLVMAVRWCGWRDGRRGRALFACKLAAPGLLALAMVSAGSETFFTAMVKVDSGRIVRRNGRMTAFLYDWHHARQLAQRLRDLPVRDFAEPFAGAIATPRNVYVAVMESWDDPRLFAGAAFSPDPLHPELAALLGARPELDLGISPVFGGRTPQAEFEIIAGVPALAELDSIDFQSLHGHPVHSLADSLGRRGYLTMATIATEFTYFNSLRAYPSLGFAEVRFIDSEPGLEPGPGEVRMFDGDVLDWSVTKAAERRRATGKPTFSYVLGLFGHVPFASSLLTRPVTVRCTSDLPHAQRLSEAASIFYHRTGGIARWIERIRREDPDALVFIASDHLPLGMLGNGVTYRHEIHDNIALAFDRGERLALPHLHYYEVPYLLMERLTGTPQAVPAGAELVDRYHETMALGLGFLPGPPR